MHMAHVEPAYPSSVMSTREQEIIRHVVFGMSNDEVARSLHISVNTVKRHLYNIFQKLGVRRRHELTRYALRAGIV